MALLPCRSCSAVASSEAPCPACGTTDPTHYALGGAALDAARQAEADHRRALRRAARARRERMRAWTALLLPWRTPGALRPRST